MTSERMFSVEQAYSWMVEHLQTGDTMSPTSLTRDLGTELAQRVILLLDYLVARGLVTRTGSGRHSRYVSDRAEQIASLLREKAAEEGRPQPRIPSIIAMGPASTAQDSQRAAEIPEMLVVSVPLSLAGKASALFEYYPAINVVDMKVAFKRLLEQARNEISLTLPFLELDGLMYFADQITGLGQRKVAVRILTRELLLPRKYDYTYHQKLKAFAKFIDLYTAGGGTRYRIAVRDYTIRIGGPGDERLLYEGIHQKMIVVDGESAYIGSGEIRAASFISNGDVGVVHSGVKARFWQDYFNLFWSEAEPVEHRFFAENIL